MLKFYFHHTPNPMKVALFLEESGLPYQTVALDILKGDQHAPEYRKINPNAKAPAIVDEDGTAVFDSNAILLYLAEKSGKCLGDPKDRGALLSWLMFVATGLGPYSGQSVHFSRMAPEKLPYAINRYRKEVQRHYQVLDERLEGRDWLVGDGLTVADIACWGWIDRHPNALEDGALEAYPNLKRWFDAINARPAVARARKVGADIDFKSSFDDQAARAMFPQNY